jgi:hypothetical protein
MSDAPNVVRIETAPPPVHTPPPSPKRRMGLRMRLSRIRALILTSLGIPKGFFIQYAYTPHLKPVAEIANHKTQLATFTDDKDDRPVLGRGMFPALDGMAAYAAVRRFKPQRIIEIGSGDSTHFLAAGVKDNRTGTITCIDPEPRRGIIDLEVDFKPRLMTNVDAELASHLEANDILFIDSSHIMLPGMDVDIQFNRLFPRLKKGVIVHLHDIFLPDDYPPDWRARHYAEQNALIGWLVSGYFEILWPGQYVFTRYAHTVGHAVADIAPILGAGSLWLRKT